MQKLKKIEQSNLTLNVLEARFWMKS